MKKYTLELCLNSLRLEGSFAKLQPAERLVIATLVWPRPMIAERISSRPVRLLKGVSTLKESDWSERILFKESVSGPFGIVIRVTESLGAAKVSRFLAQWGGALLRLAGTETAKLAGDPWSASLARIPLQLFGTELSGVGKEPAVDAAGRTTVISGEQEGILRIPLVSPTDRYRTETRRIAG
ncbi:MAG: hypothetical protein U1E27_08070, partial [Kiritimatiellia bacterium]|nr:hypothetical protein [Kiritimatiellia bacterium]